MGQLEVAILRGRASTFKSAGPHAEAKTWISHAPRLKCGSGFSDCQMYCVTLSLFFPVSRIFRPYLVVLHGGACTKSSTKIASS